MVVSAEIHNIIREIKSREHLILFYDTEEAKRSILFPYLEDGLSNNKGILYICSDETPEKIHYELDSYLAGGLDEHPEKFQIRNYDEWYIRDGSVDPLRIISQWKEVRKLYEERDLGLRVAGETSCFFREGLVRELLRYEYSLHKAFDIEMDAVCAYNVRTIVETGFEDVIMPLIRAHGKALFLAQGGHMMYESGEVEDIEVERLLEIEIT